MHEIGSTTAAGGNNSFSSISAPLGLFKPSPGHDKRSIRMAVFDSPGSEEASNCGDLAAGKRSVRGPKLEDLYISAPNFLA